jgi:hypothetical protein
MFFKKSSLSLNFFYSNLECRNRTKFSISINFYNFTEKNRKSKIFWIICLNMNIW